MNHRILIIHTILPRPAIGLIILRLSLNDGEKRKEFSYTPLALLFRRARALTIEPAHSIKYVGQDGVNVVIAPRFEFTLQLASSLRAQLDHHWHFAQQTQNEGDEILSISYPVISRNYLELAKATDQQRRSEVEPALLMSTSVTRHYPSLIGSNYYQYLKQTFGHPSIFSMSGKDNLNPKKAQVQWEWKEGAWTLLTPSVGSVNYFAQINSSVQRYLDRTHERLSHFSMGTKNYLRLATHENQMPGRLIDTVFNTQNTNEVRDLHQQVNSSAVSKSSLCHDRVKAGVFSVSEFYHRGQFSSEKNRFVWKFHRQNRSVKVESTVNHLALTLNHQFLTRAISKVTQGVKTSFSQRQIEKLNEAYSNSDGSFTSNASPASNYGNQLWKTESWDTHFPDRQIVHQKQSGSAHERVISPAQVSYRTESKPQSSSVTSMIEPAPLPTNPPKIDIDRLSRDVWNKIEKRIRIERERHGRL